MTFLWDIFCASHTHILMSPPLSPHLNVSHTYLWMCALHPSLHLPDSLSYMRNPIYNTTKSAYVYAYFLKVMHFNFQLNSSDTN